MATPERAGHAPPVLNYRPGSETRCPDCGETHWLVGRATAECAGCSAALPIVVPYWNTIRLRAA